MRAIVLITASFALAIGCGGNTISSGASGGSGGTSSGGTSSGGTSSGGTSSGGTSSGGTSSGGTSSGGTSGSGGSPDWYTCSEPGQCQLFATNCCGGYCSTDTPISGWVALNSSHVSDYQAAKCPAVNACPACMTAMQPYYLALCRATKCTAVDLRKDALSACKSDSDCRLRWGGGCCEQCNAANIDQLVAINKNANFTQAVCGSMAPPCCAPAPYPPDALAVCNAGHCSVSFYVGP